VAFATPVETALENAGQQLGRTGQEMLRITAAAACKMAIKHNGTGGLEHLRTAIDEWERRVVLLDPR
jgi:hypothetical protein